MYAPTSTAIFSNIVHDTLVQFEMLNNLKTQITLEKLQAHL